MKMKLGIFVGILLWGSAFGQENYPSWENKSASKRQRIDRNEGAIDDLYKKLEKLSTQQDQFSSLELKVKKLEERLEEMGKELKKSNQKVLSLETENSNVQKNLKKLEERIESLKMDKNKPIINPE